MARANGRAITPGQYPIWVRVAPIWGAGTADIHTQADITITRRHITLCHRTACAEMNVVPLHRCLCGKVGQPNVLTCDDEEETIFACAECVAKTEAVIARVRPIFEALLACGVSREVANETMSFMLDSQ